MTLPTLQADMDTDCLVTHRETGDKQNRQFAYHCDHTQASITGKVHHSEHTLMDQRIFTQFQRKEGNKKGKCWSKGASRKNGEERIRLCQLVRLQDAGRQEGCI
ncbi:hypothetical protein GOODEAATRI_001674 [Goodea atripinnis]|uniref:Uncharacterized protein n=1 Tax=Goodea atripinnis TaxID=208336 RepID=A0ABV0PAJ8_9TELE